MTTVLYAFPRILGRPGVGHTAYHQVEGYVACGWDAIVCTKELVAIPPGVAQVIRTTPATGVRVPERLLGRHREDWHDAITRRALRRHRDRIDIVHGWPGHTERTFALARDAGIPIALEAPNTHVVNQMAAAGAEADRIGLTMPDRNSHAYDEARIARYESQYAMADVILAPSTYARDTFIEHGVDPGRVVLHQYGFDPDRWPAPPAARSDRPFTAIFVGRAEVRKGLHLALRAWIDSGAAEEGRFIVCGEIAPWYEPALQPMLAHPSVELVGFSDDPGTWMRQSDVLVLPSVEEGSALVSYEAQASGCVPLVSDAVGARVAAPEEHCVHRAGDVATLTRQLAALATDPEMLARLRQASIDGRDRLTWAHAARDLTATLSGLLRERAAAER